MNRKFFVLSFAALGLAASVAIFGWPAWPPRATEIPTPEVAAPEPAIAPVPASAVATPEPLRTETLEIRRRDTVVAALLRHDVPSATAHEIAGTLREAGANLRQVRPGDELRDRKSVV